MRYLFAWVIATAVSIAFEPLAVAKGNETWQFDVVYQGLFSAGRPVDVADATLSTQASPGEPWSLSEIAISSAGHAMAESLYPFRYRVRSLHNAELGSLAFARFKRARKSNQEVWLLDHDRGRSLRYRIKGQGAVLPDDIAKKIAPGMVLRFQREGAVLQVTPVFDQLSLLQRLRTLPFQPGASFRLSATDGKKLLDYRITVVGREQVELSDRAWNTWKLRIESRHANGRSAHFPVLLWLEDSNERIPVKAEARHPVGTFILRLAGTVGRPDGLPVSGDSGMPSGRFGRPPTAEVLVTPVGENV